MTAMIPGMQELKARLKTTWMFGDSGHFATYLEPGALALLTRLAVAPGTRMLDVACGAGQIAVPPARAGVAVTGVDIAANLIEQARRLSQAEGVTVQFDEGDAEALPYDDASAGSVFNMNQKEFIDEGHGRIAA